MNNPAASCEEFVPARLLSRQSNMATLDEAQADRGARKSAAGSCPILLPEQ
jgi:hypothetical protein